MDPVNGSDSNEGSSLLEAFRSLNKLKQISFSLGDTIYLVPNQIHQGSIELVHQSGSVNAPIVVTSFDKGLYGKLAPAIMDSKGHPNGILIRNSSHIKIVNLSIKADGFGDQQKITDDVSMRCGILVQVDAPGTYQGIALSDLTIRDIFYENMGFQRGKDEVRTANGLQSYGWGIRFINRSENGILKDLQVEGCVVENVAHTGIKFTGRDHNITNLKVYNNTVYKTGGPGIQMSGVSDGHIRWNHVSYSGRPDDSRKWGRGSGLWTWGSDHVLIEKNYFTYANGPADSAGCHIDFNCNHVVVQYNFSAHNAGGFCEILGNNRNCAYRYNSSVNDGHRVKGEDGAFQEGKLFWLSGYVGRKKERHGPYNSYFYNNTIYTSPEILAKIAVTKTAEGVLIANNIFHVTGQSKAVLGDQYNPEIGGFENIPNVIFRNNLFLKDHAWPEKVLIQPRETIQGDSEFTRPGDLDPLAYIPTNTKLIANKGIRIPKIPMDTLGLKIGLEVQRDILGNPIQGLPDLGAVELN